MAFSKVARFLSYLLFVEAGSMSTCIIWSLIDGTGAMNFVASVGLTAAAGGILYLFSQPAGGDIRPRDALGTVGIGWILIGVFGSLPYLFEGVFTHPADAFFESVSGFTTTGSTALTDISICSRALLYWRSLTHWLGGMGIIVLFIAVFPSLGVGGKHLYRSEVPGPMASGLRPKLRHTSIILWYIYAGITAAEFIALMFAGLDVHQAICHSFATMATGGFSTMNASIAGFNAVSVEMVILVFMFLAGVNFQLYYRMVGGDFKTIFKDTEFRTYAGLIAIAILFVTANIVHRYGFGDALRYASFQVVSIQTTTGFGSDDFNVYPPFAKMLLVGLMFVGASAGSTAGGIKISRILVVFKSIYHELYRSFRPHAVASVKIGRQPVPDEVVKGVLAFFCLFIILFFVGALFLAMFGIDIVTSATASIAALGNIGPGLERVGSIENYAFIPPPGKVMLALFMIIGRLEIAAILVLLVPAFWRK